MILCEFTPIGGTLRRISTEDLALTYQWYSYIQSITSIKIQLSQKYGGHAKPTFSDMTLSNDLFADPADWPPAKTATVKLIETDTDETGGVVIYQGTAQRSEYDRNGVKYVLRQNEFAHTTATGTVLSGTLLTVVANLCGSSKLNLTVDSTNARATSPAVSHTTTADIKTIDLLDLICAFFCHGFKIVDGTIHLFDMLGTRSPVILDEFSVMPCTYRDDRAVSLVVSGTRSVSGDNANGDQFDAGTAFHTTGANILAALSDIKTILSKNIISVSAQIGPDQPKILDFFTMYDESTKNPLTTSAIVTSVIYNYDTLTMTAEAYGEIL